MKDDLNIVNEIKKHRLLPGEEVLTDLFDKFKIIDKSDTKCFIISGDKIIMEYYYNKNSLCISHKIYEYLELISDITSVIFDIILKKCLARINININIDTTVYFFFNKRYIIDTIDIDFDYCDLIDNL